MNLIRTVENLTGLTFGDARKVANAVRHDAAPMPAAAYHVNRNGGNPHRWVSPIVRVRRAFAVEEVAA